jgi:hypothetical protein
VYRNEMLYAAEEKAVKAEYHFAIEYDVVRNERVVPLNGSAKGLPVKLSQSESGSGIFNPTAWCQPQDRPRRLRREKLPDTRPTLIACARFMNTFSAP